ncbi:hypothetical protein [Thiothrix fructosivorans]|jgi:hypothetical protein|uniref:Uncharacterized protein n=1 Tax=Thiothrix fructosivorans TaxID=111770 RepID=A0A8B0SL62_9GAMM|nr:hypothetical protein [Thiothrix fructosivorans]MBO0612729.1 hypothetical protein [Thiothrix fructosivorans]QTX11805.1 hypothetical protein J1836_005545 [Thiothrix fructosivorans]
MTIESQVQILNRLSQIMYFSATSDYERLECVFDFEQEGKSWSVESTFSCEVKDEKKYFLLNDDIDETSKLVFELHSLMQSHTGGDWRKLVIIIDNNDKIKTRFIY